MSAQSDAAKAHIEALLKAAYPYPEKSLVLFGEDPSPQWKKEHHFALPRRWAFDYAVPAILCANSGLFLSSQHNITSPRGVIEIDGGTFQQVRTGHASGVGLRGWREKNNAAMSLGWSVWHYAPEEVIKAGRKVSQHITAG